MYIRLPKPRYRNSEKEATARISKASHTSTMLKSVWKSKQLRLYSNNVNSVLLYGSERFKLTDMLAHKLETKAELATHIEMETEMAWTRVPNFPWPKSALRWTTDDRRRHLQVFTQIESLCGKYNEGYSAV